MLYIFATLFSHGVLFAAQNILRADQLVERVREFNGRELREKILYNIIWYLAEFCKLTVLFAGFPFLFISYDLDYVFKIGLLPALCFLGNTLTDADVYIFSTVVIG